MGLKLGPARQAVKPVEQARAQLLPRHMMLADREVWHLYRSPHVAHPDLRPDVAWVANGASILPSRLRQEQAMENVDVRRRYQHAA